MNLLQNCLTLQYVYNYLICTHTHTDTNVCTHARIDIYFYEIISMTLLSTHSHTYTRTQTHIQTHTFEILLFNLLAELYGTGKD